jgi:proteic killer suppression protein
VKNEYPETDLMIRSFRSAETERLFADQPSKKFRAIQRVARRKLEMINSAGNLNDLRNPPGNRLEKFEGRNTVAA